MLLISEAYCNETKGWRYGASDPYPPFTADIGQLFRSLQKEYGRCRTYIWAEISGPDGQCKYIGPVGWVFEKLCQYTDSEDLYLQNTWVTLHEGVETTPGLDEGDYISDYSRTYRVTGYHVLKNVPRSKQMLRR